MLLDEPIAFYRPPASNLSPSPEAQAYRAHPTVYKGLAKVTGFETL